MSAKLGKEAFKARVSFNPETEDRESSPSSRGNRLRLEEDRLRAVVRKTELKLRHMPEAPEQLEKETSRRSLSQDRENPRPTLRALQPESLRLQRRSAALQESGKLLRARDRLPRP